MGRGVPAVIGRRGLLGMVAAAAGGGGLVRRPDQVVSPPPAVLAPGGAAGVFRGRLVIVYGTGPGSGVFVYDPSPGAGNLVASITEASTDQYGNGTIPGAIASYGGTVGYAALGSGAVIIRRYTDATAAQVSGGGGRLILHSGQATAGDDDVWLYLNDSSQGGPEVVISPGLSGTAPIFIVTTEPGNPGTAETWHPLTLASGWSAVSGFPTPGYRLNALGNVELTGRITHASLASSGLIANLPAGYYSTYQRGCPVSLVAGSPAASGLPRLYCSTSGQLNIESLSSTAGTVTLDLDGSTFHLSSG